MHHYMFVKVCLCVCPNLTLLLLLSAIPFWVHNLSNISYTTLYHHSESANILYFCIVKETVLAASWPLWFCAVHFDVCVSVCVCSGPLVLDCWMLSLPVAEWLQLHSPLRSVIAHRWLFSSALLCVRLRAQTRPPGIWEEPSRIYTHKSDRCMVCHYPPLIIILPLLFILWATLAVFPARLRNICTVALWSDRCSWGGTRLLLLWIFCVCRACVCAFNLLCFHIYIGSCVCTLLSIYLDCFVFAQIWYFPWALEAPQNLSID